MLLCSSDSSLGDGRSFAFAGKNMPQSNIDAEAKEINQGYPLYCVVKDAMTGIGSFTFMSFLKMRQACY